MPNSKTAGTPSACAAAASRTISSGESWNTPGMAATGAAQLPAAREQRQDELRNIQRRFGDEAAQRGRGAQPARAGTGNPGEFMVPV